MSDEYCININTVEADKAIEIVLERLSARAKELRTDASVVGIALFFKLQEAIECELTKVRATKVEQ
jgi:hypothetical protein